MIRYRCVAATQNCNPDFVLCKQKGCKKGNWHERNVYSATRLHVLLVRLTHEMSRGPRNVFIFNFWACTVKHEAVCHTWMAPWWCSSVGGYNNGSLCSYLTRFVNLQIGWSVKKNGIFGRIRANLFDLYEVKVKVKIFHIGLLEGDETGEEGKDTKGGRDETGEGGKGVETRQEKEKRTQKGVDTKQEK